MRLPRVFQSWFLAHRVRLFLKARLRPRRPRLYARLRFDPLEVRVVPATYVVTSTDDTGAGSLRQAIEDANANPGADTVAFNIPGTGVQTIAPLSDLPDITDTVTIDGFTQSGASANTNATGVVNTVLTVVIDGAGTTYGTTGLRVFSGGSTVQGLSFVRWQAAVQVRGNNALVAGSFFGLLPDGTVPGGNAPRNGVDLLRGTSGSTVGGTTAAARNVFGGHSNYAITVDGSGHGVTGNLIGLAPDGMTVRANQGGVLVYAGAGTPTANVTVGGTATGAGNVIAGNTQAGVTISNGTTSGTRLLGNYIGTDATGSLARGNGTGVLI